MLFRQSDGDLAFRWLLRARIAAKSAFHIARLRGATLREVYAGVEFDTVGAFEHGRFSWTFVAVCQTRDEASRILPRFARDSALGRNGIPRRFFSRSLVRHQ